MAREHPPHETHTPQETHPPETTLDPQDWSELRELGHRMVDEMLAYHRHLGERPAWQPMPPEVDGSFREPLPRTGKGAVPAYEDFKERVLPYTYGNIHPRFWGFVCGTGTSLAMLTEMLAAAMNPNVPGCQQSPVRVEEQVLAWCKEMLGFPAEASGILVSGGSMANLYGLTVARFAKAGYDVRREGLQSGRSPLVVYASTEAHSSVQKAIELLGLGSENLRFIDVDDAFRIDLEALAEAVRQDRSRGRRPIAVVGNAGAVNSGAIDDLEGLADFCAAEDLWLHVDGAFGALAAVSETLRPRVRGLERADSLAFDLHKWMYMPYGVGCVLVRDAQAHRDAFALVPPYLAPLAGGLSSGTGTMFADYGVELSRRFRALKVWMSIQAEGMDRFVRLIEQNVEQARYFGDKVEGHPFFELMAPVSLNVVCFRYRDPSIAEEAHDELNRRLLVELQERGVAVPSQGVVRGRACIRVAITNHRSRREDFDVLLHEAFQIARELVRTLPETATATVAA